MKITSAHGGGGKLMDQLIHDIFEKHFANEHLSRMEDSALLTLSSPRIAFTTDSFVVTPLFFPGGDIGRLCVCGTVNDLLMRGAVPKYLSCGFILEEGLDTDLLEKAVASMAETAREAGVQIVCGDTKVVEGSGGMFINTAGIGVLEQEVDISVHNAAPGDAVIISGDMGDHHACILSARMNIQNSIKSDCAPLTGMVAALTESGMPLHALRDITRGGLATVLHEIALASQVHIALDGSVPLAGAQVQGFCDILGLDPLYMGNEGKLALLLPAASADKAIEILHACPYGENARIIGQATACPPVANKAASASTETSRAPGVSISTVSGGRRVVGPLPGEGLPRIC